MPPLPPPSSLSRVERERFSDRGEDQNIIDVWALTLKSSSVYLPWMFNLEEFMHFSNHQCKWGSGGVGGNGLGGRTTNAQQSFGF